MSYITMRYSKLSRTGVVFDNHRIIHIFLLSRVFYCLYGGNNKTMKNCTVAVIQNKPSPNKEKNIGKACQFISEAAQKGADLIVLPEIFYYPYILKAMRKIADTTSATLDSLRTCASENNVYLCTGSLAVKKGTNIFNTAYLIAPDGTVLLEYSKSHLFNVNLDEITIKESSFIAPGNRLHIADTDLGKIGIIICYDIRFPEVARRLAMEGAEILLVPAAFNDVTGPAHWHLFFRTRAAENQMYVVAASQARSLSLSYKAYGHSMVVNPWGEIITEAGINEEIIYGNLSADKREKIITQMPLLSQRRPDLY